MGGYGLSDTVMNLFFETPNVGPLDAPDGEAWAGTLESGRYMRMQIHVDGDRVTEARFGTSSCAVAIAAGAWVTVWVAGKSFEEVEQLSAGAVLDALGGIPRPRRYCAALAVQAIHGAVADARRRRGDS